MATINIDAAWLAARTSPYILSGENNIWVLQQDVTTDGAAFIIEDGTFGTQEFDLNGYTITYDNEMPSNLVLLNWNFASGDLTGWTSSGFAGNSGVYTGAARQPDGPIRVPNDGDYCVHFDLNASSLQSIESDGTVTLENNERYFIGFWVNSKGYNEQYLATIEIVGTGVSFSYGSGGQQTGNTLGEIPGDFIHNSGGAKTGKVKLTVQRTAGSFTDPPLTISYIFVLKANQHGVTVCGQGPRNPGFTGWPAAISNPTFTNNIKIYNGTIQQSNTGGFSCASHALMGTPRGNNAWDLDDLTLRTRGWVDCIAFHAMFSDVIDVDNCTFYGTDELRFIQNRHNFHGHVVRADSSNGGARFTGCVVEGGVGGGFLIKGSTDTNPRSSWVKNTTIEKLHTKYTNGFGLELAAANPGSLIDNVTIDTYQGGNVGDPNNLYGGRGIRFGNSRNWTITNCDVSVKTRNFTQEAQWICHALQYEGSTRNCIVGTSGNGNTFRAYATHYNADVFRINADTFVTNANNEIAYNTFIAFADDFQYHARGCYHDANENWTNPDTIFDIHDNEYQTNSIFLWCVGNNKVWKWKNETFTELLPRDNDPSAQPPETVIGFVKDGFSAQFDDWRNTTLVDPVFTTTPVRDQFDVMVWHGGNESNNPHATDTFYVDFITVFDSGAQGELVEIKRANTSTVLYSGTTNVSNQVSFEVRRIDYSNTSATVEVYDVFVDSDLRLEDWTPEVKTTTSNPINISSGGQSPQTLNNPASSVIVSTNDSVFDLNTLEFVPIASSVVLNTSGVSFVEGSSPQTINIPDSSVIISDGTSSFDLGTLEFTTPAETISVTNGQTILVQLGSIRPGRQFRVRLQALINSYTKRN